MCVCVFLQKSIVHEKPTKRPLKVILEFNRPYYRIDNNGPYILETIRNGYYNYCKKVKSNIFCTYMISNEI